MKNNASDEILSYCGNLVRQYDPDRFLISMFLPANIREDVWALLAFNHEIAKTREIVSESTLGLIRLQWWRDAFKDIYENGRVLEHEVVKPLALAIERHDLPRELFDKLCFAREFDLEDVLPGNVDGLMNYADFTTEPLYRLITKVANGDSLEAIVQPVAINYTIAGLLRATQFFARQNRFYLPEDLMRQHSVTKENIFEKEGQVGLRSLVKDIVDQRLPVTKPSAPFLRGCEALSEMYFKQIKALGYDIMSPLIAHEPPFKALKLFWKIKVM